MLQANRRPGTPEDWIVRASGDLALAKAPLPDGAFYEDLCFHAQQAAEKAIKAVYVRYGLKFRYIHDLDELLAGLERKGVPIPQEVNDVCILTNYAWEARYPGVSEPVTTEEHKEAVAMAEKVVKWAWNKIGL